MSSGNHWVDQQVEAAGAALAAQWRDPKAMQRQQPENNLHPNVSALQFRIKLIEDRCEVLEKILRGAGLLR